MSFASLCISTYTYPVSFLSKCTPKKFLRFEHPTAKKFLRFYHATAQKLLQFKHPTTKKFLRFYHATAKRFLRFPELNLKRPAISRKKNLFLRTQKEALACALFLGCTVFLLINQECHTTPVTLSSSAITEKISTKKTTQRANHYYI